MPADVPAPPPRPPGMGLGTRGDRPTARRLQAQKKSSRQFVPGDVVAGVVVSRGSVNHFRGQCRPCWFQCNEGRCAAGAQCNSCHFEHPEGPPARKVPSQALARPAARQAGAALAAALATDMQAMSLRAGNPLAKSLLAADDTPFPQTEACDDAAFPLKGMSVNTGNPRAKCEDAAIPRTVAGDGAAFPPKVFRGSRLLGLAASCIHGGDVPSEEPSHGGPLHGLDGQIVVEAGPKVLEPTPADAAPPSGAAPVTVQASLPRPHGQPLPPRPPPGLGSLEPTPAGAGLPPGAPPATVQVDHLEIPLILFDRFYFWLLPAKEVDHLEIPLGVVAALQVLGMGREELGSLSIAALSL